MPDATQSSDPKPLVGLLGLLHAVSWSHRVCHWQAAGPTAFQDHLLFERIYGPLDGEIDGLAEKMVATHGVSAVDIGSHIPVMMAWLSTWSSESDLVARALHAEQTLQSAFKQAYDTLKTAGTMSMGLDNFLMSVMDTHETHVYLLQQRLGEGA